MTLMRSARLIIRRHPEVYDPAEDTFLLANNLAVRENDRVLEIGVGSGYVSLVASENAESVRGVDINPHAVKLAKLNAKLNNIVNVEFIIGDIFSPINGRFDLILLNPPYLQAVEGLTHRYIDYSWSGGEDGMRVTNRFLNDVESFLESSGRILIVQSSLSGYDRTVRMLSEKCFRIRIVAEEKLFFENLYLIEAAKKEKVFTTPALHLSHD